MLGNCIVNNFHQGELLSDDLIPYFTYDMNINFGFLNIMIIPKRFHDNLHQKFWRFLKRTKRDQCAGVKPSTELFKLPDILPLDFLEFVLKIEDLFFPNCPKIPLFPHISSFFGLLLRKIVWLITDTL